MLTPWHYLAIAAPLLLLLLSRGTAPRLITAVVFGALLFAAAQATIDLRIRTIRAQSVRPIGSLPSTDPVRRRFGLLHGVSSLLFVAQAVAAAIAVGRNNKV